MLIRWSMELRTCATRKIARTAKHPMRTMAVAERRGCSAMVGGVACVSKTAGGCSGVFPEW
jgi:hypothetical protein